MMALRTILIFMIAAVLVGCASAPGPSVGVQGAQSANPVAQTEPSLPPAYRLGSGDQLRIIVFGEEELSGEFFLDGSGTVSLPLIGEVPATGKTLQEFRSELEARLSDGYLTDPRVSAEVLNYRPFYILGEVNSAGEYPYTDGLTVLNAVARAGGFTYRANENTVVIQRADGGEDVRVPLTSTLRVMPGDTITIIERFF